MKYLVPFAVAIILVVGFTHLLRLPSPVETAVKFCNETGGKIVMVGFDRDSGMMLNCIYPESIVPVGEM